MQMVGQSFREPKLNLEAQKTGFGRFFYLLLLEKTKASTFYSGLMAIYSGLTINDHQFIVD